MSQFEVREKDYYAIYEQENGKPLVRLIQAEDPDDAWEVAETLGTNLIDVVDIPPTGDVEFLESDAIPKTWERDRHDLNVDWSDRIVGKLGGHD